MIEIHRGEPPFKRAYNEGSIETPYAMLFVEPFELDEPQRSMLVDALAEANNRRKMIVEDEKTQNLFNDSAAYQRILAAIVGNGLQGGEQPDEPWGTKNKKVIVNGEPITIRYRGFATGEPYNVHKLRYGQSFDQDFSVFIDGKIYTAVRHWTNNGGGYTERWTYNGVSVSSEKKLAELILSMQDNGLQGTKKAGTNPAKLSRHCTEPTCYNAIRKHNCSPLGSSNNTVSQIADNDANIHTITNKAINNLKKWQYGDFEKRTGNGWRTVLGWFQRLFNARYHGDSSYNNYETPKGIMDFRIANHTANPDNFKKHGKDVNISVYVAINDFEFADADVDYMEYRYSKEDYAAHTDEIINAIVKGFRNALKTGHFADCTYLATPIHHQSTASKKGNRQTYFPEFKHWFGDWEKSPQEASKVMADGRPLVVYHGTPDGGFTTFANTKTEDGYWFTNDYNLAYEYSLEDNEEDEYPEDAQIYEVYLNMRNPIVLDAKGQTFDKMERAIQLATLHKSADGVIVKNIIDPKFNNSRCKPATTYFVKHANQIKSATDNCGKFNPDSDDILEGVYGLLFNESDAQWNLTAEDIALIDELQKQYAAEIPENEPERNRRNAQLAYCLIKFLNNEKDTVTKAVSSNWYTTNKAYINPEHGRFDYIAEYFYHNPATKQIVSKYVPQLKKLPTSIKKMFEFLKDMPKVENQPNHKKKVL